MCMRTTNKPESTLYGAGDWTNGGVYGKKSIVVYRPEAMAFLKEGRSDSIRISSGRLFQIFGAKNENKFVPCLTLL